MASPDDLDDSIHETLSPKTKLNGFQVPVFTDDPKREDDDSISTATLTLHRNVYTKQRLEETYHVTVPDKPFREKVSESCFCRKDKFFKYLLRYVPIVNLLREYNWREDMFYDFISGFSTAFLLMPMGMALALLSDVPPILGLYTCFFPSLLYCVFGTSRHVSMGTNALISLLSAVIIDKELEKHLEKHVIPTTASPFTTTPGATTARLIIDRDDITFGTDLTNDDIDDFKIGLVNAISLIAGSVLLGLGMLRFGFLSSYLGESFLTGFTTSAGFHIITSQISKILHVKVNLHTGVGKLIKNYNDIYSHIEDTNFVDVTLGVVSIIILLIFTHINSKYREKLKIPIPTHLILVVISTLVSHLFDLHEDAEIDVVGTVDTGFKMPKFPPTGQMSSIFMDSVVIGVMIYAVTIAMAKTLSKQHNYPIDDNQELVAYGMCNFVGALLRCMPSCTAPPRSLMLSMTGCRSTLNVIFSAAFIFIVIMIAGKLFKDLPVAVLAAMIMVAVKRLVLQLKQLPNLWRVSKPDFFIFVITFLSGVLGDLDISIVVGVTCSILSVIVFGQMSKSTVGGVSASEDLIINDRTRYGVKPDPRVKIFCFQSQLHFANAEKFKKEIYNSIYNPDKAPKVPVVEVDKNGSSQSNGHINGKDSYEETNKLKTIIVDCSAMTYIDLGGVNILKLVIANYERLGIKVFLAKIPQYTYGVLDRSDFFTQVSRDRVVHDVFDAIYSFNHPDDTY